VIIDLRVKGKFRPGIVGDNDPLNLHWLSLAEDLPELSHNVFNEFLEGWV
jgi:hypothetical protein